MSIPLLADLVLLLHVAVVLFVVAGLPLIVGGNLAGWRWVNAWWFRLAHLFAIAVVVAESWLGIACPLTTLEVWLRAQAGQAPQVDSFIGAWMQRLLYYTLAPWVFVCAYTAFGLLVLLAWWRFPPNSRRMPRGPAHKAGRR
jgi:accessory gene regulator protein AgrB